MKNVIIDCLKRNNISLVNEKVVVAMSCGVDSSVLLNLLLSLKDKYKFEVVIAHVNHHKRKESEIEEKYIRDFSQNNNLKCYIKNAIFESKSNFQKNARDVRYLFFKEVLEKENAKYLFLAHHATDNVETILMRILRGSNLTGYSGIKEFVNNGNYFLLRPLLSVDKEKLYLYAKENNIKYFEDASNFELDYTRNRIRNEVIPLLRKENYGLEEKFRDFSKLIQRAEESFNNEINHFIENNITLDKFIHFKVSFLIVNDDIFIEEVLFKILKKYNLSKNNIYELKKLIFSSKKNIKTVFKNIFTFVKEYDDVFIYEGVIEKCDIEFEIDEIKDYKINDNLLINVSKKNNINLTNLNVLWYNSAIFPLTIRSRRNGDKIFINNGYQKVKDVLINEKIGIMKRENLLLGVDKNNEVLIIFGVKKSSKLKEIKNCDTIIELKEINNA